MKELISVMMVNIVAIGCFTFLAYYFNHWWIVLFSILFLFEYRDK